MTTRSATSRRRFIKNTASSVAGLALASKSSLSFPATKPSSVFNGVQIGTITYSYRSMPDQSAEGLLGYIVESGINAVELMGNPVETFAGRPEDPAAHEPAVEAHADDRADAGTELRRQVVGERTVQREERSVDADGDGTGERLAGARLRRRPRNGGRRRGSSPPRGTPCGRSARTRPSRDTSDG